MSLAALVSQEDWTAFDEKWTELMLEEGPTEPVLEALSLIAERKRLPRCMTLVREHAELLVGAGRAAEATELLGRAMLLGGNPGELAEPLFDAAEAAWKQEGWWKAYADMSDLRRGTPDMRSSWRRFHKLRSMVAGRAVYHAKGWGAARITELRSDSLEVHVEFADGRRDRFPLGSAADIFEILDEQDLRAIGVLEPERLQEMLKKQHLEVLEGVLRRFNGRAAYNVIKNAVVQLGLTPTGFAAWWRKARKLAEGSGWFEVTGTGVKAQVQVRYSEADPTETMRRQLRQSGSLDAVVKRVRDMMSGGGLEAPMSEAALEVLEELTANEAAPLQERLGAWMLLRDQRGSTPEALAELLREAAAEPAPLDPSQPPALWSLFQSMPGAREQERCLALLQEIHTGGAWLEEVAQHLPHAAPGMARPCVDALLEAKRGDVLIAHYASLLARPLRNPHVLVTLAETAERGKIRGDLPGPVQRAQVLLGLDLALEAQRIGDPAIQRTKTRLGNLLAGDKGRVLRALLADADKQDLRAMVNLAERGVEPAIDRVLTDIVVNRAPEVYKYDERPFWETGGIWTTRAGLERRRADLRELHDVKIPENTEAIGRAAAFGDLSENSEWEAAIEEQRNLAARAKEIEDEVRSARVLEDAVVPENTVAPGTAVRYREGGGDEQRIVILGPWDSDTEGAISYRSPLALGMLGKHPGDRATIELPGGTIEVELLAVEPAL